MSSDFWSKENTVRTFPERPCLACGEMYCPDNNWSERCPTCKRLDRPKHKKIVNQHFNGKNLLPHDKLRVKIINGVKMPSVTTVLHPHGIDFPAELLNQYAARGTLVHKQVEMFLKTGNWYHYTKLAMTIDSKDKQEREKIHNAIDTLENGSLKLKTTDCNFRGFYKEFRKLFTYNNLEQPVHNEKYAYCGTYDCHGTYKGKPAIIDFKTAGDYNREKLTGYFQQLSAYANADQIENIKYLVVIPLSPRKSDGYESPYISTKIDSHFREFLIKRKLFKKLYGI